MFGDVTHPQQRQPLLETIALATFVKVVIIIIITVITKVVMAMLVSSVLNVQEDI